MKLFRTGEVFPLFQAIAPSARFSLLDKNSLCTIIGQRLTREYDTIGLFRRQSHEIDITTLSEDELSISTAGSPTSVSGVLTKYNKKTVTVLADNGEHLNVSPGLLTLAKDNKDSDGKGSNVIQIPKR